MVRGAVRVRVVEGGLVVVIVVQGDWLVGVDVPFDHARHLWRQGGAGQRVVEIAGLPIIDVRVGVGPDEGLDQVGVARVFDGGDGVFQSIRVQVADDEEVGVAAAGGVCRQPIDQRSGGVGAGLATVALAIAHVRVSHVIARGALRFQVADHGCEPRTG